MTPHERITKATDILIQVGIATRYALSALNGLPSCDCGTYQFDGEEWIAKMAIGGGFTDQCEGEPISEWCCMMGCQCIGDAAGNVWGPDQNSMTDPPKCAMPAIDADALAGGDAATHENVSIAGGLQAAGF